MPRLLLLFVVATVGVCAWALPGRWRLAAGVALLAAEYLVF